MPERPAIGIELLGDGPVVAMVSGGSDSTALLLLLVEELGPARVHVLHVNHLLRGADSDADERFVAELCEALGVPCEVRRIDVGAIATQEGGNLEAVARRERHAAARDLLERVCAQAGVPVEQGRIATAHTRDDRVETFVMRAARGTGPGGLASIRPASGPVVHPLLSCSRDELRAWLVAHGQGWREDATNLVPDRDRTYVRLEVLPALHDRFPAADANIARALDLLADEDDYLAAQTDELRERLEIQAPIGFDAALDAAGLADAPRPLARRVVHALLAELADEGARVEARRIDEVVDGAADPGFATDLPGGVHVVNNLQTLCFSNSRVHVGCSRQGVWDGTLSIPGELAGPDGWVLTACEVAAPDREELMSLDPSRQACVDVGATASLAVSSPVAGERMQPLGMDGRSRKLFDVLADAHVPAALRTGAAIVRLGDGQVVWAAGVKVDERARVSASTARAVLLTLERRA